MKISGGNLESSQYTARGLIFLNNRQMEWENLSVTSKNMSQSNTCRMRLPLWRTTNFSFDQFSQLPEINVEIYTGNPSNPMYYSKNDLELIFTGIIDTVQLDLVAGCVNLSGRDLSSKLIDNKTTNLYPSKTASEIAVILAHQVGLKANVVPTKTLVGNYYSSYNVLAPTVSDWDLLSFLAQQENYSLFVDGHTLNFIPKPTEKDGVYIIPYTPPSSINPTGFSSCETLSFTRTLTLARDIVVKVQSFSQESGRPVTATVRTKHTKNIAKGSPQKFVITTIPGLTQQQVLDYALKKLRSESQHEIVMHASLPGANDINPRNIIRVEKTETAFNQIYYVDFITRSLNISGAYKMQIQAKNHATESQVAIL